MIECPACGWQLKIGELFCRECGIFLLSGKSLETDPLPESELPTARAEPHESHGDVVIDEIALEDLILVLPESGRKVPLPSDRDIVLGRSDAARHVFPTLDLSLDCVTDASLSVSRRHACIFKQNSVFLVQDLGSVNGTFLNGRRLAPYLPYPLHANDELQLGSVRVLIKVRQSVR